MISQRLLFYERIRELKAELQAADVIPPSLFKEAYGIFQDLIYYLTAGEKRYYAGFRAKTEFVFSELGIGEDDLQKSELAYRFFLRCRTGKSDLFVSRDDIYFVLNRILQLLSKSAPEEALPEDLFEGINRDAELSDYHGQSLSESRGLKYIALRVIAREKTGNIADDFICTSASGEVATVRFYDIWSETAGLLKKNTRINLFNVDYVVEDTKYISVGKDSSIVIEPDYMTDATDIAECFDNEGYNVYIHFLKRFSEDSVSESLVAGSIVNSIFDDLIVDPNVDFDTCYSNAVRSRLLSSYALASSSPKIIRSIRAKAALHFENIRRVLPELDSGILSVEPAFISPVYGIKGRLDLMQEFPGTDKKNIIELKSGKPPSLRYFYRIGNKSVQTGLWANNLAQTTCYNLLLDSAFENRTGNSLVFYSASNTHALRNAPAIERNKQEVLQVRNWIATLEKSIASGNVSILEALAPENIGKIPSFLKKKSELFISRLRKLDELERAYYEANISFIYRDIFANNTGVFSDNPERSAAAAWNTDILPADSGSITGMSINREESDFEKGYIQLDINREQNTSIRRGDALILYPEDDNRPVFRNRILKCAVKSISEKKLFLTLRNKMQDIDFFDKYSDWAVIPDNSDNNLKKNLSCLSNFLDSGKRKRRIILGREEPKFGKEEIRQYPELSEIQNELLRRAVSAKDYFILQGPPGTGKTSFMLKYIVKEIFENSEENLLLTAYTNQAVDEICEAVSTIGGDFDFLRLGSKESSRHRDFLLSELGATADLNELYKRVVGCRVLCCTTSFAVNNPEIFELKKIDTVIVDEAAQIIESQIIGILMKANRFIMIGDEKQLPAICMQSEVFRKPDKDIFADIFLSDLGSSLFARLLKTSQAKRFKKASGMLTSQARMHSEIREFPGNEFYGGLLTDFNPEKANSTDRIFDPNSSDELESYLASSRSVMINLPKENYSKMNISQAKYIARIVGLVIEKFGVDYAGSNIGIIAPFRLQCSTVKKYLPESVRDKIIVDTVERFQGSQRDIIILSVAANTLNELERMTSPAEIDGILTDRKLNVALTRASKQMVVLGSTEIMQHEPVYKKLIEYHSKRHSLFSFKN